MEKLTLEQIISLLPHKLKCQYKGGKIVRITGFEGNNLRYDDETGCSYAPIEYFKPLLYPISSLTKPMEDGSVPIFECLKLASGINHFADYSIAYTATKYCIEAVLRVKDKELCLGYDLSDSSFILLHNGKTVSIQNQLALFRELAKRKINYMNLPEHLWIDVTTLP